jgi:hypothetical protein
MIQKSSLPENLRSVSMVLTPDTQRAAIFGFSRQSYKRSPDKILQFLSCASIRPPDVVAGMRAGH